MPVRSASCLILLLILLETAAFTQGPPAAAPPSAGPLAVAERFIAGFNRHDLTRMIAETDADVRWMSVVDDRALPDARGQAALQEWMARFFSVYPTAQRTIEQSIAHGPFVSAWERDRWKDKRGEDRTQAGLVVYEVRDGKIRNVWRYAPQP
jgi:ketosteroid isomerase-like protein